MHIIIWKKKVYGPSESLKGGKKIISDHQILLYTSYPKKKKIYYILNYFKSLIINKHLIEIVQATYPLKE